MAIQVSCPGCGTVYPLSGELRGKEVRCRRCGRVFRPVEPEGEELLDALPADEPPVLDADTVREGLQTGRGPSRPSRRSVSDEPPPRRRRAVEREEQPGVPAVVWVVAGVAALALVAGLAVVVALVVFDTGGSPPPPVAVGPAPEVGPPGQPPVGPAPGPGPEEKPGGGAGEPPPAGVVIPPAEPVDIRPPALGEGAVVRKLPGPVRDVCVGGAGRFLVLHLPSERKLAVFDVNEAKVVKYLPAPAGAALLAAGMDKLAVVRRDPVVVERWSLRTFGREAEAPLAMKVPPAAVALGWGSNGPLVISGVDWPRLGETVFFDVLAMRRLEMSFDAHDFFQTSPDVFLRASADGGVFACQQQPSSAVQSCVWSRGAVRRFGGGAGSFPVPGPDGRVIYTTAGLYTEELKPLRGGTGHWVPAHHGPYAVGLPLAPAPGGGKETLSLHLAGEARPFAHLGAEGLDELGRGGRDTLSVDKRVHLIPDAKLLVTIPAARDRLLLRRVDVLRELEKSGLNYLVVTSRPPASARKGGEYAYRLAVRSRKGGATYRLASAPAGMRVDGEGRLSWKVPADFAGPEAEVTVAVRDRDGQEVMHPFRIGIKP